MTLKIDQSATPHPERDNYWRWQVWIDGPSAELDEIEQVTYFLHPTFKKQVRFSSSRHSKFKIKSSGWGEFKIRADVRKKSGVSEELSHWLRLQDDFFGADRPANVKRALGSDAPRSVFLSYAASDADLAESMKKALESEGVHVKTGNELPLGVPWEAAIREEIRKADVTVAVKPRTENAWLDAEVKLALENENDVVAVVLPDRASKVQPAFQKLAQVRIKDASDGTFAVKDLAARLGAKGKIL